MIRSLLLFFILFPLLAAAQSAELSEAYQKKMTYQNAKDYKSATVWGEKAISLAEKEFGKTSANYGNYASDLASLYQLKSEFDLAGKWYLVSYKIYSGTYGADHAYTSTTAYNLALVNQSQGKSAEAESYFLKAIQGYEKSLGTGHDYYKMVLQSIIQFYDKNGEYRKLDPFLQTDLEIVARKSGRSGAEYAAALNNLALNYSHLNDFAAAEKNYLEALKILESQKQGEDYANISANLYQLYLKAGLYEKALIPMQAYADFILKTYGKDSHEYALALSYLGELCRNLTRYQEAEKSFSDALVIVEKTDGKGSANYATLLNNLGYLYKLMGQYERGEQYLLQALAAQRALGKESQDVAVVLNNLGLLKTAQGKYEAAETFYLESASIYKKHNAQKGSEYGSTLNNLGLLYSYMGRYGKALALLNEAREVKSKTIGPAHHEYANTLINIANIYSDQGSYAEAEKLYKECLQIYKAAVGTEDQKYANNLTNLGKLYFDMGQYDKALSFHNEALGIKERTLGKEHPESIISLNFIGICYLNSGETDKAEDLFKQTLALRKKVLGIDHPDVAVSMSNLALIYQRKGRYADAAAMLEQCVELGRKNAGQDNLVYASYLNNLASVYVSQKLYGKARDLFMQCRDIRAKGLAPDHLLNAEVLTNLANVHEWLDEPDKAEPYFLKSNEIYYANIRNKFPYLSEKDKEAFFFKFQGYMNSFYSFCVQRSAAHPQILEQMYNNQLNFKALLLNDTKQLRRHVLSQQDESLKQLYEKWIGQREYLAKLYALDKAEIEKRGIDLTRQEELANELEKEFAAKSDFFAQVSGRKTITWKDIQARLKPGEAAVEIIRFNPYQSDTIGSSVYIALILSPQTKAFPSGLSLGTDKELEGKSFSYFINSVKHKLKDENSYAKYWAPLKAGLEKEGAISKVYLSADGVYNKISMNALQNPASGQFLSDEIDIHLVSNTKILAEKKTSLVAKNKRCELYGFPDYSSSVATGAEEIPVVAANRNTIDTLSRYFKGGVIADLPATETEVKEISGILKGKGMDAQIYLRKEASEERLKNTESPLVLHIATHGFFMKDEEAGLQNGKALSGDVLKLQQNPLLRSGLLLAGVANSFKQKNNENYFAREDGMFTAYEAMNLDLSKTELVVLSACETGLGEIRNGEGVYGLQRALEISGARAILMSLWTVNDEATRELMVEFYKGWMETGNKREAFKKAQQKLKEKYKDPYYWAAFVLMGE